MSEFQVGDSLPIELLSFSAVQCPVSTGGPGVERICVLDSGHTGVHVAADPDMVVRAAWN